MKLRMLGATVLLVSAGLAPSASSGPATVVARSAAPAIRLQHTPLPVERVAFRCGEKSTCGEMDSCEEAYFHLKQCGLGKLDRDKDGVPCESICPGG